MYHDKKRLRKPEERYKEVASDEICSEPEKDIEKDLEKDLENDLEVDDTFDETFDPMSSVMYKYGAKSAVGDMPESSGFESVGEKRKHYVYRRNKDTYVPSPEKMRMMRNTRRVFWLIFVLFGFLSLNFLKIEMLDAKKVAKNPYNSRLGMIAKDVKRGSIYADKGEVLAQDYLENDKYIRQFLVENSFAHVVGSLTSGSGIEKIYNFELNTLEGETLQRFKHIFFDDELKADSVVTTIHKDLQELAYKRLQESGKKGAVVAIEPSTGKILAMTSFPSYNPSTVKEDWEKLRSDEANSPLLNRASQGLYPPGSTFKIITAVAVIESNMDDFEHVCEGVLTIGDDTVKCSGGKAHGKVDLEKAVAVSCNTYFAKVAVQLGQKKLLETAERFGFNKSLGFELYSSYSSFSKEENWKTSELMQTGFGQGRTLATPLEMALVVSSVANNGIMMKPYIVDSVVNSSLSVKNKTLPESLETEISTEVSSEIGKMLLKVVKEGTGQKAARSGLEIAGKTGTAQNATGNDHSWFVGYAPFDNPKIAVAIIIEETEGGSYAMKTAGELLDFYIKKVE